MKAYIKFLGWSVLVVIVLLLGVWAVFNLFAERLLRIGVETAATRALNVGVSVGDLELSIPKGSIGIYDLKVKNPAGYTYETLLELADGTVTASLGSLLSDTVHIKKINLTGIVLTIEQKVLSNNLRDVISSIPAAEKKQPETPGKKLRIDELEIRDIKVNAKLLPLPGKADTVTLNLAPIRMTNLGSDDKLSTAMLTNKIMVAIAEGIAKEGVGVLPGEMIQRIRIPLGKTAELGQETIKKGEKVIEDTGKLIEGFKGLLKPAEKE